MKKRKPTKSVKPKPYAKLGWVKRLLEDNGLLLDTPRELESDSIIINLLALVWFVMLIYGVYLGITKLEKELIMSFIILTVPLFIHISLDGKKTDNAILVWAYKLSNFVLKAIGILVGLGIALIAYFLLSDSIDTSGMGLWLEWLIALAVLYGLFLHPIHRAINNLEERVSKLEGEEFKRLLDEDYDDLEDGR